MRGPRPAWRERSCSFVFPRRSAGTASAGLPWLCACHGTLPIGVVRLVQWQNLGAFECLPSTAKANADAGQNRAKQSGCRLCLTRQINDRTEGSVRRRTVDLQPVFCGCDVVVECSAVFPRPAGQWSRRGESSSAASAGGNARSAGTSHCPNNRYRQGKCRRRLAREWSLCAARS